MMGMAGKILIIVVSAQSVSIACNWQGADCICLFSLIIMYICGLFVIKEVQMHGFACRQSPRAEIVLSKDLQGMLLLCL